MKSLITALMICTLSAGSLAEKGLVNETRTDANGHKTIVIKDYRAKSKRPLKKTAQPTFKEYDLGPSATDPASQPVYVNYAPPAPPQAQAAPQQQRMQTYSQSYAPGPNKSMTPGGGGGSFASTVLPTYPYYGYGYGYGYDYGYYPYSNCRPWYGNRCYNNRYYAGQYPSTYPGFLPGQPSGPALNLGYPVFNTISPPLIPGAGAVRPVRPVRPVAPTRGYR